MGRLVAREGIRPCCRVSRPPTNQRAFLFGTSTSIMRYLNLESLQQRLLQIFTDRTLTRINPRLLYLEPLEHRELLDGAPLVNAQSTTQQLFVESLFEGMLQRPADSAGLDYWTSALQRGTPASQVVLAIENGPEFTGRIVDQLYATLLDRSPASADRSYWINFLANGGTIEQLEAAFQSSPEFTLLNQNSGAFLQSLYENVLSRPVDTVGLQAWGQSLASGATRGQVASSVISSLEAEQFFVQGLYSRFLDRTANASELQTWVQSLANGASRAQVFASIAGSAESMAYQATSVLAEIASGSLGGNSTNPQQLFVQFQPGTNSGAVLAALQWIDGTLPQGSSPNVSNSPQLMTVNVSSRRSLADAARLLGQDPDVISAQPNIAPVADLTSAISWLQSRSTTMIQASAVPMNNGVTAFLPEVGTNYDAFWLRDFAYMLEGNPGAFTNQQAELAGQLFINSVRWDGAGVDSVALDGQPFYEPDLGIQGAQPVADGSQFTIDVAWRVFQKTQDVSFVTKNLVALEHILGAVPLDPSNGLVFVNQTRSSYGFTDLVPKIGDDLFCSLLLIRADREMADLFTAVGANDMAATFQANANQLAATVRGVFWNAQTGLFNAATIQDVQPDIWGSAFAVYLGVTTPDESLAIANYFKNNYASIVDRGQLRELPGGMYWQNMPGPRDQYQNGGYWATPIGWFVYTLDEVDPQLADQTVLDMVQDFYVNGVHEDVFGSNQFGPNYNSSATLPLAGIEAMLQT
jgi:Domain of unknown function (DUF4214)